MEPLHPSQTSEPAADLAAKERHQRLFQRGLRWLCAGISLMALSFAINFLLHGSGDSIVTTMYVLTSLGVIALTKGLVDMLGF